MVRFIIRNLDKNIYRFMSFTFQYGQIYYLSGFAEYTSEVAHLHSNMVRFIINQAIIQRENTRAFTFQYGQIYYFDI